MTSNTLTQDGYLDAVLGARGLAAAVGAAMISDVAMYAEGGLPARVVDLPADDAVKGGMQIDGDDDGIVAAEMDRLNVPAALADAVRWARLDGGGAILLIAGDGRLLPDPLDVDRLDAIKELRVVSINDVSVDRTYQDPTQDNFGQPERYRVSVRGAGAQVLVHESRLIEVPGDPVPPAMRLDSIPWRGRPVVTRPYRRIRSYTESLDLAREILRRKQQAIHKMEGLADAIAADQEALIQRRIAMVDRARGVLNGVAVDSEDDYTIQDSQLTGINLLIQEMQVAVAAESGIPVTLLFGRSPGGQNATGDADFEGYYNGVERIRSRQLKGAAERIISLICAQNTLRDNAPDNWAIQWRPLKQLSEKEVADIDKVKADTLNVTAQAISTAVGTSGLSEQAAYDFMRRERLFGLEPDDATPGTAKTYAEQT